MSKVVTRNVNYEPGDKWGTGLLEFEADTPLGLLNYSEAIPGPRQGEDSWQIVITLAGVDLDPLLNDGGLSYLDFEAPGAPGRWAEEFKKGVVSEVQEKMQDWFSEHQEILSDFLNGLSN